MIVPLRVHVVTSDEREEAPERIRVEVERALKGRFGECTVELDHDALAMALSKESMRRFRSVLVMGGAIDDSIYEDTVISW